MERIELEQAVDELFERSDKRLFEVFHRIARLACGIENEGLSQIPPVSNSYSRDVVAPSSFEDQETPIT